MEEKRSQIGLYIAIIALLVGVANIFLGVLPTVELKGKAEQMETRLVKAEKTADRAWTRIRERSGDRGGPAVPTPAVQKDAPPPLPKK
jgi:hypothetical protein